MFKKIVLIIILAIFCKGVIAQEVKTKSGFLEDSTKLGIDIHYTLSAKYPSSLEVVFPDSIFNYAPFEYESKQYFPTKTDSLYSYDSAVYTFTTFEIDSVQYLNLPVFDVSQGDSTLFYGNRDSIILTHVVEKIPDTVQQVAEMPLKENISYLPVDLQFNYPYLIVGTVIFIILVILFFILFGKRLKRWWQLVRFNKKYETFKKQFTDLISHPEHNEPDHVIKVISLWKNYMEKASRKPYRQLTTKEIYEREKAEELRNALRELDRSVYSGQGINKELSPAYLALDSYADIQYNNRVKEIKNG